MTKKKIISSDTYEEELNRQLELENKDLDEYYKSASFQKMSNYLMEIVKYESFQKIVAELRNKYEIPDGGFKPGSDEYEIPPENFDVKKEEALIKDMMDKICKKYALNCFDYYPVLLEYLWYNHICPACQHQPAELSTCGLFRISDLADEKINPYSEELQEFDNISFPIAIRISPYASKRDLTNFINNKPIWQLIAGVQERYRDKKIKIGRIKHKNYDIQERNNLIYENKNKPIKEIRKMLADKNIFMDDGHIAKVKSLEIQRRKDV